MPPTNLDKVLAERSKGELGLTNISTKVQNHSKIPLNLQQTEFYLEEVEKSWQSVDEAHVKIITLAPENKDDHEIEWNRLFDVFTFIKCNLRGIKASLASTSLPVVSPGVRSEIKLPKINLPTFAGEVHEWISFRDMFLTAIHNNGDLSDVQKFTYLKSSLTGDAAKLVKSLNITSANYPIAWDAVTERFENKRELCFSIMKRFMSLPAITNSNANLLRSVLDAAKECTRSLDTLCIHDKWDSVLLFLLTQKLDSASKEQWELSLKGTDIPPSKDLVEFIGQRTRSLAASSTDSINPRKEVSRKNVALHSRVGINPKDGDCSFCNGAHFNFRCQKFITMKVDERRILAQQKKVCFNCLRIGHRVTECQLEKGCKSCGKKHHSLLHLERPMGITNTEPPSLVQNFHSHDINQEKHDALLATAVIRVRTTQGGCLQFRALLDGGSTVSCISEACIGQLGLERKKIDMEVIGLGSVQLGKIRGLTELHFKARFDTPTIERFSTSAYILKKITCQLPLRKYDTRRWNHLDQLPLADPAFYIPADIDILLGADVFFKILLPGKRSGNLISPDAINSKLGWLVSGPTGSMSPTIQVHHSLDTNLDELLTRFWKLDQVQKGTNLTREERDCEEDFQKNYSRDGTGRFIVRMPMKDPKVPLGSSRESSMKRLLYMEKKLAARPELKDLYLKFMEEYENLGHMSKLKSEDSSVQRHYIPHHYVLKDMKHINKFRVVFDGSAKTSSGYSINDAQMVGPVVQESLYTIIMRFRLHRVAFVADITKMYRQILIQPEQRHLQCILWRTSPQQPIQEYQLSTVTYGTASAPFLATRVLKELGDSSLEAYPLGSRTVLKDFYMDDVMSGEESNEKVKLVISQLRKLTSSAGFTLCKFAFNSPLCLSDIPVELKNLEEVLSLEEGTLVKTLGLYWDIRQDQFRFKIQIQTTLQPWTKRILLSEIAKIFDPMGWLAPIIIKSKLLMQDIWREKTGWDEPLSTSIQAQWNEFQSSFHQIQDFRMERWIHASPSMVKLELDGFSDASERAYAGVVYLRSEDIFGQIHVSLIASKTRVAPANQVLSIPRLELCGALLLAELIESVQDSLGISFTQIRAWTDSTIVLGWISSCPRRWKIFVANRVSRIQEVVPAQFWNHIPGIENPADIASRGMSAGELCHHQQWWKGPTWLLEYKLPSISSKSAIHLSNPEVDPFNQDIVKCEERRLIVITKTHTEDLTMLTRYSSLLRLRRITAWIRRFTQNCLYRYYKKTIPSNSYKPMSGPLQAQELEEALLTWIKLVQATSFPNEIEALESHNALPKNSKILSLNPEIDARGIIRVGGRLRQAEFHSDIKHPILLPRHHRFTEMLIQEAHIKHLHAGAQLVHGNLSLKYWIIRARDAIRHQIRKCVVCTRQRAETVHQMMGNLPRARLQYCRAFTRTGVDYAGPFLLRPVTRSKNTYKAYIALFVCFVTKALHLEIVSSLSTEAFIAALRRFTARRGCPSDIYSDCGTNFVGAAKELKDFTKLIQNNNEAVNDHLSTQGITWHFNPAGAPHFGGLWEAGVKSVKYHLHRVVGQTRLTYEEFSTIITQIEGCLNSRPLTPMSSDPTDFRVLTPGHFLIGESLQSVPEPDLSHIGLSRLGRWQLLQKLQQDVKRRWLKEYITRLQQRPKWMTPQRDIKVGDMVLVKSDVTPTSQWPLARVTQIHPGLDLHTRVVTLRTSKGEIKRPVVKLCLLPFNDDESEDTVTKNI